MSGGSRIIDLRPGAGLAASEEEMLAPEAPPVEPSEVSEDPYEPPSRLRGWIIPACAILLSFLGVGAILWLAWPSLNIIAPTGLADFIAALCVPPALIGLILLLALRTSTAEAQRFGDTARAMRAEAASLEHTVAILSHAIDTNRHKLAEQTAALMAIGDNAVSRLANVSVDMAEQVSIADMRTHQLAAAAAAAQTSLGVLLATLPKAHAETADFATLLERTGMSAGEHASALDAQLVALAERGREADSVANGAAQKLAAHITRMEATSETAGARLEAVTGDMSSAVEGLLGRTAQAVDEARKGIADQGDAMLAMLNANQAALDRASHDSVETLAARIASIEEIIGRIAERLGEQRIAGEVIIITELGNRHHTGFATPRYASWRKGSIARGNWPARSTRWADRPMQ